MFRFRRRQSIKTVPGLFVLHVAITWADIVVGTRDRPLNCPAALAGNRAAFEAFGVELQSVLTHCNMGLERLDEDGRSVDYFLAPLPDHVAAWLKAYYAGQPVSPTIFHVRFTREFQQ